MYSIFKIEGDGNCLFRAIAHQINELFYLTLDHKAVRQDLARYVEENQDDPEMKAAISSNFPNSDQPYHTMQYSTYIANQYFDKTWGGTDILLAAANFYIVNVIVHRPNGTSLIIKPQEHEEAVGTINLLYNGYHYDSIIFLSQENNRTSEEGRNKPMETPVVTNIQNSSLSLSTSTTLTDEVADSTGYRILGAKSHPKPSYELSTVSIATWNIRGAADAKKKNIVDQQLTENQVDIACLQETHLKTGTLQTKNYVWHLTGSNKNRGLAILIRKNTNLQIKDISHFTNVMAAVVTSNLGNIYVITAHVPQNSSQATYAFSDILYFIKKKPKNCKMAILGDFNAHVGYLDIKDLRDSEQVGKKILHMNSNKNGEILIDIMRREKLKLNTSFCRNSCLKTWKSGTKKSQIDHILTLMNEKPTIEDIKGIPFNKTSDHKLIIGKIKLLESKSNKNTTRNENPPENIQQDKKKSNKNFNYRLLDYGRLKTKETCLKYQNEIIQNMSDSTSNEHQQRPMSWEKITDIMKIAANNTLLRETNYSKERRFAGAQLQKAKFLNNRFPNNPTHRAWVKECRNKLRSITEKEEETEFQAFFENLRNKHRSTRMRITYDFYRRHVQTEKAKIKHRYIPMSQWESELSKMEGPHISLHDTENLEDLNDLPTKEDVIDVISKMRGNTAPGIE